jgi:peptide deformylase
MAILKIARMGDPILRRVAEPVTKEDFKSGRVEKWIADLWETMEDADGLGLAAPQVHLSKQLVVFGGGTERYPGKPEVPRQVLINPEITPIGTESMTSVEGCLSLPGLRGVVVRHKKIAVVALDEKGKELEFEAEGFHAVVIQHETDHLFGRLYIDRLVSSAHIGYEKEFHKYILQEDDEEI